MKSLLNKSFISLLIAQIFSLCGDAMLRFALPLFVLNVTGSATLMGVVGACAWIPYIVLTPFAGVAADRVNKRRIMAVLDICLALSCGAYFAFEGILGFVGVSLCALIILYTAQSMYQPTVQASVPFVVPRKDITRASALVSQVSALSGLIGPMMGGLLFGLFGIELVIGIAGAAFALSAVLLLVVVTIPHKATLQSDKSIGATLTDDLKESFLFLRHERTLIFKVILLIASINLTLTAFILIGTPVIVTEVFGLSNQYMGFAVGTMAAGSLCAGVMVSIFSKRLKINHAPLFLLLSVVGLLPFTVVLGLSLSTTVAYSVLLGGLFIALFGATAFSVLAIAFVQLETPVYLVGKVIALAMTLSNCAQPLGQLVYGSAFDGLRAHLFMVALTTLVIALLIALITQGVMRRGLAPVQLSDTANELV